MCSGKEERRRDLVLSFNFTTLWDVISGMETNLESPLSEVDVISLFHEGLIQDNFERRRVDAEVQRKARPDRSDSFEKGLVEPASKIH